MSGSKHTPGPWERDAGCPNLIVSKTGGPVCEVWIPDWRTEEEDAANAALIAKAPEMAERIQGLEGEVERLREREYVAGRLLDRVQILGGAGTWTTREMREWCCDYKGWRDGAGRAHYERPHDACPHREHADQEKPADDWTHGRCRAQRDELLEALRGVTQQTAVGTDAHEIARAAIAKASPATEEGGAS